MATMKIIDSKNLSLDQQWAIKKGNPLFVTKYRDKKTGKMKGKDGRVIWDGKDFVFIPERVKL